MNFLKKKIIDPILDLLKQGISPEKIALSVAFGFTLGVFPVLGSTVILCTFATFIFRLNIVAIQLVNYLVYPLQLILFIPFIRLGEFVLGHEPFPISMTEIFNMLTTDILGAIQKFWVANLHGIFAWALVCPVATAFIYVILLPVLRRVPIPENLLDKKEIKDV
jgi:uncharacterized protein (DUF2062 family)